MQHFIVAAELRVLVLDGIEAVRAGGDNGALSCSYSRRAVAMAVVAIAGSSGVEAVSVEYFDILLGHHLPQVFVANAASGIACTGLFRSKNSKVDFGR